MPNLIVDIGISYNIRHFLPPSGIRGLIQKLTQLFFLKWIWGRQVLLIFLLSVTTKGTSFSNFASQICHFWPQFIK